MKTAIAKTVKTETAITVGSYYLGEDHMSSPCQVQVAAVVKGWVRCVLASSLGGVKNYRAAHLSPSTKAQWEKEHRVWWTRYATSEGQSYLQFFETITVANRGRDPIAFLQRVARERKANIARMKAYRQEHGLN
jgi:hypothetical protein